MTERDDTPDTAKPADAKRPDSTIVAPEPEVTGVEPVQVAVSPEQILTKFHQSTESVAPTGHGLVPGRNLLAVIQTIAPEWGQIAMAWAQFSASGVDAELAEAKAKRDEYEKDAKEWERKYRDEHEAHAVTKRDVRHARERRQMSAVLISGGALLAGIAGSFKLWLIMAVGIVLMIAGWFWPWDDKTDN